MSTHIIRNNLTLEQIEDFIKCPELGYDDYGKWGALPREVRITIYWLIYEIRDLDERIRLCKDYCDRIKSHKQEKHHGMWWKSKNQEKKVI